MVVTKFFLLNRVGSFVMRAFACKIILLGLFFLLLNQQIILCGSFQESEERGELLGVEVLELLKKFPNFENAPLLGGDTPLHVACRWGLYETFDSILNSNSSSIHAVNANDPVEADVPIRLTGMGESPAERAGFVILQSIESIPVCTGWFTD